MSRTQLEMQLDQGRGATFSICRTFRYRLWRYWDFERPYCNFIALNPSTADDQTDDPTVKRVCGFARRWGYGGVVVTNLFACRATHPSDLQHSRDPIGPENDGHIRTMARAAGIVVCAWGNHGRWLGRAEAVRSWLAWHSIVLHCLGLNGTGEPVHPLYQRTDAQPVAWRV